MSLSLKVPYQVSHRIKLFLYAQKTAEFTKPNPNDLRENQKFPLKWPKMTLSQLIYRS